MSYAARPLLFSRSTAFMASAAIHVAIGAAWLLALKAGAPEQSAHIGRRGTTLVVEMLPLPEGDVTGLTSPSKDQPPQNRAPRGFATAGAFTLPSPNGVEERIGKPLTGDMGTGTSEMVSGGMDSSAGAPKLAGAEVQTYRAMLQDHIRRFQRYPERARLDGHHGIVRVQFVMDLNGDVSKAWIEASSGSAALDEEAVAAILRARPLPLPPKGWPASFGVALPIQFAWQ